jgi:hypothetical protein
VFDIFGFVRLIDNGPFDRYMPDFESVRTDSFHPL